MRFYKVTFCPGGRRDAATPTKSSPSSLDHMIQAKTCIPEHHIESCHTCYFHNPLMLSDRQVYMVPLLVVLKVFVFTSGLDNVTPSLSHQRSIPVATPVKIRRMDPNKGKHQSKNGSCRGRF